MILRSRRLSFRQIWTGRIFISSFIDPCSKASIFEDVFSFFFGKVGEDVVDFFEFGRLLLFRGKQACLAENHIRRQIQGIRYGDTGIGSSSSSAVQYATNLGGCDPAGPGEIRLDPVFSFQLFFQPLGKIDICHR